MVRKTLASRVLTEIDRVQDNMPVSFGDTGLVLYQAENIPEAFTWIFIAVRSALGVREAAGDVNEILSKPNFASFSSNVLSLIQSGAALANPAYAAPMEVAKFAAQAGARRLMKKGDRQLGAVTSSFIRPEHYPVGIRESHDVHDMTGNMFFDYTIFGYKRALPGHPPEKQKAKKLKAGP
jgi:hypothetical protein